MDFTSEHKKKIEEEIVNAIITSLEKSELSEGELPQIATFVLERIDLVKTQKELIAFLTELSSKWKAFSMITILEKAKEQTQKESRASESVLRLIKNGDIDQALKLAKSATNNK